MQYIGNHAGLIKKKEYLKEVIPVFLHYSLLGVIEPIWNGSIVTGLFYKIC